jgi:hypothetical protein
MRQIITFPVWDDLRAPASAINPAGSAAAATVNQEDGTLLFANGAVQTVALQFQLPHCYKEGSDIVLHCHWAKTTSAAGTVIWQTKYEWTNIGDTGAGFSSFVSGTEVVANANTANKHALTSWTAISGAGKTISSMLKVVIQRYSSGAGADTYNAAASLWEVDVHFMLDSMGSRQELVK